VKPKQLATILGVADTEVIRAGVNLKIAGMGFKKDLSGEQIEEIKGHLARLSTPQLSASASTADTPKVAISQKVDKSEGAIEQAPEAGFVESRQAALSNAMAADENQQAHILETQFQQVANDGLRTGVGMELVRATKQREGAMLVRDAVFQKSQASRDRLNELLKDSAGDDFLGNSQLSSQTYTRTAGAGAATQLDVYAALNNLGVKL
jgi:hypothetical protein